MNIKPIEIKEWNACDLDNKLELLRYNQAEIIDKLNTLEEKECKCILHETRVVDYFSDLENPTYLSKEDLKNHNYRILI